MTQQYIHITCRRIFSCCAMLGLCVLMVSCNKKSTYNPDKYPTRSESYESSDEQVTPPDLPDDDGMPLTELEKKILGSPSKLGQPISQEDWQDVVLHFKYFTRKNNGSFQRFLDRSEPWLPHVKQVFKENGIPEEIAYLAFVESGFNPKAVSRAGATGVWQFMPYTGAKYGLTQNTWVDERRDTHKATQAAADYLKKLHGDFGTWYLAMAAYNAGEGKISRAINNVGSDTFFDLSRKNHLLEGKAQLKEETRQYVPRFIAVSKIMQHLDSLGFKPPNPNKAHHLERVEVAGGTDLVGLSRHLGMSWEQFSSLNPAFKRQISHPRESCVVYIPPSKKDSVLAFLEREESRILAGWDDYKVKKGENVASLSKKFGVPTMILRKVNQNNLNKLKTGDVVMVPGSKKALRNTLDAMPAGTENLMASKRPATLPGQLALTSYVNTGGNTAKNTGGKAGHGGTYYTVSPGETLYSLARGWNSTPDEVRHLNNMGMDSVLKSGQRLKIPASASMLAATPVKAATMSGNKAESTKAVKTTSKATQDSKNNEKVAESNNFSASSTNEVNALQVSENSDKYSEVSDSRPAKSPSTTRISPPEDISRPKNISPLATTSPKKTVASASYHIVAPGETLFSLSRSWNSTPEAVRHLNNMKTNAVLRKGQRLKIPGGAVATASAPNTPAATPVQVASTNEMATPISLAQSDIAENISEISSLKKPAQGTLAQQELQPLNQPEKKKEKKVVQVADASSQMPIKKAVSSRYVVQPGDTLYSLARKNSTSVNAILKLNGMNSAEQLMRVGASIKLP